MIKSNQLEEGKFYRVEFEALNRQVNWYTVQAVSSHFVIVLTKNGKQAGGNGTIATASLIEEVSEYYAKTGRPNPENNESALQLLMKEEQL